MAYSLLVLPDGNFLSHTSRPHEIARVLREKGHRVVFAGNGEYMKLPRQSGFEVHPLLSISAEQVLNCSRRGLTRWYNYSLIRDCVKAELRLYDEVRPDLVLTDFRLPVTTSCEMAGIPSAMVLNAAWTNYYTIRARAPEHIILTMIFGKFLGDALAPFVKKLILKDGQRGFNRFRRKQGLPPRGNVFDTWRGDINLMTDIPEYAPTRNLPPDFHYVGPIIWEPEMELPARLSGIKRDRPVLYFTMGSTGYPRFFEQAVEIFEGTPYQCIMTTAGMAKLPHVPENFSMVDYAPGSQLMKMSDLVVCQGGNGTIYQAMSQGTPIVGIPTMHDQEANLERVAALGIGIQLSERKFKPVHLREAVAEILANRKFKQKALRYKEILANYRGPETAADLIIKYLDRKSPFPPGGKPGNGKD